MKKYVNGEYIEMTEEEIAEWQEAQKEVEDAGGAYQLISDVTLEEDGLIEPIRDVDYAAAKVDIVIPAMSSTPRLLISIAQSKHNGYVGTVEKYNAMRIIREFDRQKNVFPVDMKSSPAGTWLEKLSESYGRETVPERINAIYIGLGDTMGINFPAGTTVKIYAKK